MTRLESSKTHHRADRGGGQNEGPNTRIYERLDFQLATANVTVLREHDPPALPNDRQPICVPGSLGELGTREPDVGAVGGRAWSGQPSEGCPLTLDDGT